MSRSATGLLLAALLLLQACTGAGEPEPEPRDYVVLRKAAAGAGAESVEVTVELARSLREHIIGLMNRPSLPPQHGMLFIFEDVEPRSFWMFGTLIPLDIVYVSPDLEIVSIHASAQPCRQRPCPGYPSGAPVAYVLEVNGGFMAQHGFGVGDRLELHLRASDAQPE